MQRVSSARVKVGERVVGQVGPGLLVLVGISPDDGPGEARWLADKVANLRIFNDHEEKMNLSLLESGGGVLLVSQFTLYGDARKGRRPSFIRAARGAEAEGLYQTCAEELRRLGIETQTGEFGAMMQVTLTNDGPVTILLDSEKGF